MEQIQFVYFQDYMQYYTVHHKKTPRIWKFGTVDDGLSSAHNCQFVLVLYSTEHGTGLHCYHSTYPVNVCWRAHGHLILYIM